MVNKKLIRVNRNKDIFSVQELAVILGISRIAVFKRIQKGQIKAQKVGRNYIIHRKDIRDLVSDGLTATVKKEIDRGVGRVIREYGQTLQWLAKE